MGKASRLRLISMLSFAMAAIPVVGAAQSRYSWELSGLESRTDSGVSDFDATSFGATYYFGRVEDGESPYALSAFFDPATSLSITTDQTDASDSWVLSGKYLLDGSRWYLGGRYRSPDYDGAYGLIAGKYLGPRTTLELSVDTLKQELGALACFVPLCTEFRDNIRLNTTALSFVHVRSFRSLTYAFSGGLTQRELPVTTVIGPSAPVVGVEPLRTYSIQAALYPTKNLDVHLGYDTTDGPFGNDGYSVGARWFFRRNVALEFSVADLDLGLPAPYGHHETRSFRVIGRF